MFKYFVIILLSFCLCHTSFAKQYSNEQVNKIIASDQEPDGVVFELLTWDDDTWQWAAPMIAALREQLLKKYPSIDIAIVSHGGEQFHLVKQFKTQQPKIYNTLNSLTQEGVNLHVCGVHSSWQDVNEEDYLDIVDVAPSGPAQINDYKKLGYIRILIDGP